MVQIVKCCCGLPLKYGSCLAFTAILVKGVVTLFIGFIAALHDPIVSVFEPTGFDKLRNTLYALFGLCGMVVSNFGFLAMIKKRTHGLTLCIYYLHFNTVCAVVRAMLMLFSPEVYDKYIEFNPLPPTTVDGIFIFFSKNYVCPLEIVLSIYFGIILHSYKAMMTAKASDRNPESRGQLITGVRYHPRIARSLSVISEQTTPESEKDILNTANVRPIDGIRSHGVATQTSIDDTDSDEMQGSRNVPVHSHSAPSTYGIVLEKTPLSSPERNKSPVQIVRTAADIQSPDDDEREPSKVFEEIPMQVIHSDTCQSTSTELLPEHDAVHSLFRKAPEYSNVEEHALPSGSDGISKELIKSDISLPTTAKLSTADQRVTSSFDEAPKSSDVGKDVISTGSEENESSVETILTPADIQSPDGDECEPSKSFEEIPEQVIHSNTSQSTSMERLTADHPVYSSFEEASESSDTREHMLSSNSEGNESSVETLLTPADIQSPDGDECEPNKGFEGIPEHVMHSDASQSSSTELLTADNNAASSFPEAAQSSNVEEHELPSSSKEI